MCSFLTAHQELTALPCLDSSEDEIDDISPIHNIGNGTGLADVFFGPEEQNLLQEADLAFPMPDNFDVFLPRATQTAASQTKEAPPVRDEAVLAVQQTISVKVQPESRVVGIHADCVMPAQRFDLPATATSSLRDLLRVVISHGVPVNRMVSFWTLEGIEVHPTRMVHGETYVACVGASFVHCHRNKILKSFWASYYTSLTKISETGQFYNAPV